MSDPITRLNAALEGRYRIERQLGEGGMATVYLARDLKHNRNVALKVLKPELAAVVGAERFLAEIETTANLQHPHILPLFDSGEADSFLFYVMPYVEGESLREKLDREHQLAVDEAVGIATNVAEALEYAHKHAVVHRDIKPANILMLSGKPVISDFGIALAVGVAGGGRLTETGLSLGTPHYMSPEQATGDLRVGAAADIYALGCVLYEMLMGEPPFTGSTAQAILGKIIAGERVSVTAHRKAVPPNVDAAIRKALEKLPADRFKEASDFAGALAAPGFRHGLVPGTHDGTLKGGWRSMVPWGVAMVAVAIAVASHPFRPAGDEPVRYWGITFPEAALFPLRPLAPLGVPREGLAISPDGSLMVHAGFDGFETRLYRRSLTEGFEHIPIPGTEGGHSPFFSPDGAWIGFFAGTQLWRVSLRGGEPEALVEASNPSGAFWTDSGEIIFTSNEGTSLRSIPASGGAARDVTPSDLTGVMEFSTPKPLPDDDGILFLGWWPLTVMAMRISEGVPVVLTQGTSPRYLPSGHLVFARGNTLYAASFDPEALALLSDPVPVLPGVRLESGVAQYEVSDDGTLYFIPGVNANVALLSWVDTLGAVDTLALPAREYQKTMVSPDGHRLASLVWGGSERIVVIDLETGAEDEIIEAPGLGGPNWLPDGSGIVYTRAAPGELEPKVLVRRSLGSREEVTLHQAEGAIAVSSVSPDGQLVFFSKFAAGEPGDLSYVDADGQVETFVQTDASEWGATLSPDGRWVAYTSGESGQYQVYVEPFPVTGASRRRISVHNNSEEPVWSRDGSELYYRSSNQWWAVPIETDPDLHSGTPRLIFQGAYMNVGERSYDLHPEGDRFLVIDVPPDRTADRVHVITNWAAEVERLVPGASGR